VASLESADRDTDGYAADADVFPGVCCDNKLAFSAIIQRDSLPSVDPPPAGDIRSSIAVVRQGRPDRPRSYSAPFSLPVIDTLSHRSCTRPVVRELYVYLETESSALLPNRTSLFLGLVVCTSKCALGSVRLNKLHTEQRKLRGSCYQLSTTLQILLQDLWPRPFIQNTEIGTFS